MIRSYKATAIILKRTNFSEADRLITIFTKKHGKLTLIAKGIRKLTSRKKGHLELFTLTQLQIAKTKSIDIITEAATIDSFSDLRKNLNRVKIAYLFSELTDKLTAEGQEHEQVYHLLLQSLQVLNSKLAPKDLIINFEKSILQVLGFGLPRKHDRQSLESHIYQIIEKPINSNKLK